ncbi:MAG: HYR domain-containing protein [Candidatus Eisenbacteria bacterium]
MKTIKNHWIAIVLAASLVTILMAGSTFSRNAEDYVNDNEPEDRDFQQMEIGDLLVYFHQRMVRHVTVMGDYIVYQFDKETEDLVARKTNWRDDIPEQLPELIINIAQAEAMVEGEVQFSRMYYIAPDSPVFPFDPTPTNPCWVVRSIVDGYQRVTVIDAVEGRIVGNGVPPPFDAFSLTGPTDHTPCSGDWAPWYEDARDWFNAMGYSTEAIRWPTEAQVQGHIQSNTTAMFYELAHGGSYGFNSGCSDGNNYDATTPALIETWMQGYAAMPFAFIGSCAGMCDTGDNTLSYEFRKGLSVDATTVGYCHMDQAECDDCWYSYSILWQQALFGYMNGGSTVKAAFDQALADYPSCASGSCMRFEGDQTLAVVPVLPRVLNDPPVALCKNVTVSADAYCQAYANIDNGSYDPEGAPVWMTQTPPGPYPLGQTTVTLTVRDDHAWEVECTGVVTVVDNTPPVITCPGNVTVEATDACGTPSSDPQLAGFFAGVSADDNCDPGPSITDNRPTCFPLGPTTVTFTGTDNAGNSASCQADVTVEDTTPPDITCPDEITVECNGPAGTYATDPQLDTFWAGVSATDIVDPNPVITNDAPALFPLGTTVVTFTATDFSGNSSTCEQEVTVADRGIDVWLEDMIVNPGDNVLVPIYIQDVTGWGIMGFDMELCWCELPVGLLEFEYCVIGDVMAASGWGDPVCGPCGDDCISIAGAGSTPLEGEGVLFYLKFAVSTNAKPCMCCDLTFTHINLYDPEDPLHVCWQDAEICVDWCDVEGVVNYWKCCYDECDEPYFIRQLDGAYMHLTDCLGNPIASQYTRCGGSYLFDCLDPLTDVGGCYCVNIDYCPILPCVTSMDAALVLQNVVCLDDLDDCPFTYWGNTIFPQQVAADVNCSGRITSLDASYILQYAVGLINLFPCPDMWKFYAIPGNCITSCPGTVDWIGVQYGDVNGCPECPPGGRVADVISTAAVKLGWPVHYDDRVEIPIKVEHAYQVMAADIVVDFNPGAFSVDDVDAIGLASGFSMAFNPIGGTLRIGMAGMSTFSGDGKIVNIVLTKNYQPIPTTAGEVSIVSAHFNDIEAVIIGDMTERKMEYALGPIAPNPFSDGTTVKFTMATAGQVSLNVYNVNGQLVATLVDGSLPAGQHSAVWDGKDARGERVARGVYFCRMTTADMVAIEKLVHMK